MKAFPVKRIFICVAGVGLALGGWWLACLIWFKPWNIGFFYERVFLEFALKQPEILSQLRIFESVGIDGHNAELTDASEAFQTELIAQSRRSLAILKSYDRSTQTSQELRSTDILAWFLDDQVRGEEFKNYNYPLNQLFGIQSELPSFMVNFHQVNNKKEAQYYITRLSKFDTKFQQVLEGLKIRQQNKIIPPRFVITKVLAQMRAFISQPVEQNILYTSFQEKLGKIKDLRAEEQQILLQATALEIKDTVYPAYEQLIRYFTYLEPIATTEDGVWKFPKGDAFYTYVLRSNTTTDLTPDQVHELGLKEVARIQQEIRPVLASLGYRGKTVGQHLADLGREKRFLYPDSNVGREQILKDYQAIIDEVDKGINVAFSIRPKVGVKVERVPIFKEKTSPRAYYNAPALDKSRPGVFYANLRNVAEIPTWGMRTLSYHEAIPGHHFQLAIQQELTGVPTFRKVLPFTAYVEGWALYAERLAWEYGFQKEPASNLGRLQAELFRAVRLVVDTGIHKKRWTREQAIRYMEETTGMADTDVVAEIERYIVAPGQACAYKVGMLKILELREQAKRELGPKFDIKEFHNAILQNGAMPLNLLEQGVQEYIRARKAA